MRALTNVVIVGALALALGCGKKADSTSAGSGSAGNAATPTGSGGDGSSATGSGSATAGGGSGGNVAGGAGGGSAGDSPAAPQDPKLVERGAYMANVLGCGICHMPMTDKGPDFSRPFAGGLEMADKSGTWRSPNITPDKSSGIGNWTDEQIIGAIREGTTASGGHLYPIMPYLNYNRLTDADVKALVAFLRTLKPVDNVVKPSDELKMPKIPAPKPSNAPDPTDAKGHGEYLVTIMHCAICHSPDKGGAPDLSRMFAGGMEFTMPMFGPGSLYGANITSDPETGIGKWSIDDIKKAVSTMTRPDGTIIKGPMQFYLAGWSKLEDKDLTAIATYIKSLPPQKNKVPRSSDKPATPPPAK